MNQGKLEVVEQEMARVNINILGISKLKWIYQKPSEKKNKIYRDNKLRND